MPVLKPSNESDRLKALESYRLLDTPAEQSFDDFAFLASYICGTPIALISLVDANRQWFKAKVGLEATQTPREWAFCATTILGDQMLIVEDAVDDQRFASNPLVKDSPFIRFYAGAPLVDKDGYALGSICAIDRKPRQLSPQQQQAMEALARQVVAQCEFRRVSLQLAQALAEVKTLSGLIPICAHCKKVRNDSGYWKEVEEYIRAHTQAGFSHSICPECIRAHFPDIYDGMAAEGLLP